MNASNLMGMLLNGAATIPGAKGAADGSGGGASKTFAALLSSNAAAGAASGSSSGRAASKNANGQAAQSQSAAPNPAPSAPLPGRGEDGPKAGAQDGPQTIPAKGEGRPLIEAAVAAKGSGADNGGEAGAAAADGGSVPGFVQHFEALLAERADIQAQHRETLEMIASLRWAKLLTPGARGSLAENWTGTVDAPLPGSVADNILNNIAYRDGLAAQTAANRAVFANVAVSAEGAQPDYAPPPGSPALAAEGGEASGAGGGESARAAAGTGQPAPAQTVLAQAAAPAAANLVNPGAAPQAAGPAASPETLAAAPETIRAAAERPIQPFGDAVARSASTASDPAAPTRADAAARADAARPDAAGRAFARSDTAGAPDRPAPSPQTAAQTERLAAAARLGEGGAEQLARASLRVTSEAIQPLKSIDGALRSPASPAAQAAAGQAPAAQPGRQRPASGAAPRAGEASQTQATIPGAPKPAAAAAAPALTDVAVKPMAGVDPLGVQADLAQTAEAEAESLARAGEVARAERGAAQPLNARSGPHVDAAAVARLARDVARHASDGARRFEIQMDPPELGRVDVRLEVGADKKAHAILLAERPETLADLERAARGLERALAEAGLELKRDGLQFGLKQQGRDGSERFAGEPSGAPGGDAAEPAETGASAMAAAPERTIDAFGFRLAARGGASVSV